MAKEDFSWKRIQTFIIAAAGVLLLAMLACDLCYAMVPKEGAAGEMERFTIRFTERYQFIVFSLTTFALTVITIGYWKQRILQMRLCILNSILLFFYQTWIIVEFFRLHKVFTFTVASVFPAIAIILLLIAARFIGRDEIRFTVANAMANRKGNSKRR